MVDRKKLQREAPKFDGKKNVWITDKKDGFIKGEIIGTKGEEVTVQLENRTVSATPRSLTPRPHPHRTRREKRSNAGRRSPC